MSRSISILQLCISALAAWSLGSSSLQGQFNKPLQQAQFDPSDVYFQGYLASRAAEKLEQAGDHKGALAKYERAKQMFETIQKFYPDWKPEMVKGRAGKTQTALARVQPGAQQARQQEQGAIAELEGGIRKPVVPDPKAGNVVIPESRPIKRNVLDVDPLALKRLRDAEAERDRLKKLLAEQMNRARVNEQAHIDAEARNRTNQQARTTAEARNRANEQARLDAEKNRRLHAEAQEKLQKQLERYQKQAAEIRKESAAERVAMQRKLQQEVENMREGAVTKERKLQADLAKLRDAAAKSVEGAERNETEAKIREEASRIAMQRKVEQEVARIREQATKKEDAIVDEMDRMRAQARAKEKSITQQMEKMQAEARRRKKAMQEEQQKLLAETEKLRAQASAKGKLAGINKELAAKVQAAENQVQSLRSKLAAAPMQSEVDGLNQKIKTLEQERKALGTALNQSREEHDQALAKIKLMEADLKVSRQNMADIQRNLEVQQDMANEVVAGQRRQLRDLDKQLTEKDVLLVKANERIAGLTRELQESRAAFAGLRDERDALLLERDQMSALLKLNEAGRVQELIEQNMALARDLRVANEKVDRLHKEGNEDKDTITNAKRDLVIAKAQINRLQQEKRAQDARIAEMGKRLREEEKALADGSASADPAEVQMLRDIISRQLKVQKRRRQAREILLEAARDLGKEDEELAGAIDLLDAQEVELSPEEMKLLADKPVDGEFLSPVPRDPAVVELAMERQRTEIRAFERAAQKSFVSERYLSTREIYETILDQNPGHTPSLCRVGVVHLKLEDPMAAADAFQRAVELDEGNSYAHRMLGFCHMNIGDMSMAEHSLRRAVDLAPDDAKSQHLIGMICYRTGRVDEAVSHFKAAITVDPVFSEPYFNIALIMMGKGKLEEAREYYDQALERGALPDPKMEDQLP